MRPTVIRLIVGGALGIAFSVSLWLPGTVVFPEEARIRHMAAPDVPSTMIVRAAPVAVPKKAPAPRRVDVRPFSLPTIRTAPAANMVRNVPSRVRPSPKAVTRTSPPTPQRLTPLSVRRSWEREERPDEARKRARDHDGDDDNEGGGDRDDG